MDGPEIKRSRARLPARLRPLWISLAVLLTVGLLHGQILTGIASFMTIRDPLERAELILPLYHDADTVPFAAAELYRLGYANRIALARTRPLRLEALGLVRPRGEVWRAVFQAEGIPPEAIVTIGSQIKNEVELARSVAVFLGNRRQSRIIVVASAPWSRIVRSDFRQGLAGSGVEVRIYSVPPREFDERSWWQSRHGWVTYFDTYYLWMLRFLRG